LPRTSSSSPLPPSDARQRFRRTLLKWYRKNGRDLPWRKTDDPYHILVSEIMLQQTQVDRVLPKYHEWIGKYPSLAALAQAPEEEVTATWYPLGYNVRPRRLQAIAREAVEKFGGVLPSDEETLRSFRGIGDYTVGAIRSFAFRERAAILDTNVARVPQRHVFDFNQALMDFGAMVCVARKPKCLLCPLRRMCRAYPWNPENEAA
jgi:A/G-specific adenine glycosylase